MKYYAVDMETGEVVSEDTDPVRLMRRWEHRKDRFIAFVDEEDLERWDPSPLKQRNEGGRRSAE